MMSFEDKYVHTVYNKIAKHSFTTAVHLVLINEKLVGDAKK